MFLVGRFCGSRSKDRFACIAESRAGAVVGSSNVIVVVVYYTRLLVGPSYGFMKG